MTQALRIAIGEDEPTMREYLQKTLPHLGHQVVASARTGRELVDQCRAARPDLVITDIRMPELDGIAAAAQVFHERPTPVILLSAYSSPDYLKGACDGPVFAYLVKPIKEADLPPAIALALSGFEQFRAARQQVRDLQQALDDRQVVERVKGLLMKCAGVDEEEAYRRLQRLASDRRAKLADMARTVLAVQEAFQPAHQPRPGERPPAGP